MTIRLLSEVAPRAVNNFVFLARDGFYEDNQFHRVINGFMIQGRLSPAATAPAAPGYRFRDEAVDRSYTRGTLAMANAGPNTNGSQWFIVHGADVGLPPNYTIFGMLTDGDDVLEGVGNLASAPEPRRREQPAYRTIGHPQHRNHRDRLVVMAGGGVPPL